MISNILTTYQRQRFIEDMNQKWQKKYDAEIAWLEELDVTYR